MAILAKREKRRKGECGRVEMWLGMVVSLIDRPWSRVLRAGRGRTSLAWGPANERAGARDRQRDRTAVRMPTLCSGIPAGSTGPKEGKRRL